MRIETSRMKARKCLVVFSYRVAIRRHPRMVRQPLAGRSHLRGNPQASRHRDPAPMVRSRHPAHHTRSLRPVRPGLPLGSRSRRSRSPLSQNRRLVSQAQPHLQRRQRRSPTTNLAPPEFFTLPATGRSHKNPSPTLAPNGRRSRLRHIISINDRSDASIAALLKSTKSSSEPRQSDWAPRRRLSLLSRATTITASAAARSRTT